jgi:FtsZ-binding cell division protein ZapB
MSAQSKLDDVALRNLATRFRRDYSLDSTHRPHPYDIADALEELANLRLDRYHTSLNQLRGALQEAAEKVSSLQAQLSQVQAERDRWHDERNALLSAVGSIRNGQIVPGTECTQGVGLSEDQNTWNHPKAGRLIAVNFPPSGCISCALKSGCRGEDGTHCSPKERKDSRRIAWMQHAP